MLKKFRNLILAAMLIVGAGAYADPPTYIGGVLICDPPCDVLVCSGGWCQACNADGCVIFKDSAEETGQ